MNSLAANENNDIFLDADNNIAQVTGIRAVAQNCATAMKAQFGEMIYAADKGLPTLQTVWDDFDGERFEAASRATLGEVPGVVFIRSFEYAQVGDVLTYSATIETIYGVTEVVQL